jgi:hypothetical protein
MTPRRFDFNLRDAVVIRAAARRESDMSPSVQLSLANVLAEAFCTLRKGFLDPYRPERHYMRGPGPKWREKHQANAPVHAARERRHAAAWRVSNDAHAAAY